MAFKTLQQEALEELELLKMNHAESGRDRELCFPSIEEEEEMAFLEDVADGVIPALREYSYLKLNTKCQFCCKLDLTCPGEPNKDMELDCQVLGPRGK